MSKTLTRLALSAGVCCSAIAGVAVMSSGATSAPTPERPNFVFVLVDDLDKRKTPYLDVMNRVKTDLAAKGLTFSESFAPTPICCPARASILIGQYGHNSKVLTNTGDMGGWGHVRQERRRAAHLRQAPQG